MNTLDNNDSLTLYSIISDEEATESEKFGAAVLLENIELSSKYFDSFSPDEKEAYKQYPIYTLYKNLLDRR